MLPLKMKRVAKCTRSTIWTELSSARSKLLKLCCNKILKCVLPPRNPYDPSCLAKYGGPIEPAIALGGFETPEGGSPKYETSKALIITFLVNNHHNKTNLGPAKEWEKRFVEYMQNWTATMPDWVDVAFTSERSIEDELERGSKSDISTIIVSYVIMFMYIALALGQMKTCDRLLVI